jgi:hypothetical protein
MRYSFLGSMAALLTGASLAVAQPWMGGSKPAKQPPAAPPTSAPAAEVTQATQPPATPAPAAPPAAAMPAPRTTPAHPAPSLGGLPPPVWGGGDPCCHDVDHCCDPCPTKLGCCEDRLWWSARYLLYWVKHSPVPPLVTTGVTGDPPGAIGQDDTVILLGGTQSYKPFSGVRVSAGYAIDNLRQTSIVGSFFVLGGRESVFQLASDDTGRPAISRPFFSNTPPERFPELFPGEDVHSVARPDLFAGNVRVGIDMDLLGAELSCAHSLVDVGPLAVDCFIGGRYLYMCETLDIRDRTLSIGGDLFLNGVQLAVFNPDSGSLDSTGFAVATHDRVRTVNHFYGGQIGLRGEYSCDCFYISTKLKVALGATNQMVHVEGDTTAILPDNTQINVQGGVLALQPNIGRRERTEFAVIPEVELNVGFYLNERVRVFAGYTFMYWSNVARPGEQLDRVINPSFLPTADPTAFGSGANPQNPRPLLEKADFWLHGITTGFEYHF